MLPCQYLRGSGIHHYWLYSSLCSWNNFYRAGSVGGARAGWDWWYCVWVVG